MVEFISAPVISGFCSAAALTVASTQVKGLFGLKFKGSSFIETWKGFFTHIEECNPWDSALGCSVIVILLLIRVGPLPTALLQRRSLYISQIYTQ